MKNIFFVGFALIFLSSFSQKRISGMVTDENNQPLEGASVYINNTTIGVVSDSLGNFSLIARKGNYDLVVSFLGHKTVYTKINTNSKVDFLNIYLIPEVNVLEEVVLKKTRYNTEWKNNFFTFKKTFLGWSKLAQTCKILNPKVLHFDYDNETSTFSAEAREPLKIEHKGLGYLITYDLVKFSITNNRLEYLGYTKYKKLKGSKRKEKRWKENRLKAYNGSIMHFARSLRSKKLKKEGFIVNQFKRLINHERPTEEQFKNARILIRQSKNVNLYKKIYNPVTALDSAIVILQKFNLPKVNDIVYRKNVPYKYILTKSKDIILLRFLDYISITYLNEPQEENYPFRSHNDQSKVQTSIMTLLAKYAILDSSGAIINPHDTFVDGYWAFEQFADTLPLNYMPTKD